ncbi:MAG: hypothetical protein KC518_12695 [Candidatus Cloacimonetes bacterium]|nr:hypothetical protein [Candidatus Cloacimonadota bacterium]
MKRIAPRVRFSRQIFLLAAGLLALGIAGSASACPELLGTQPLLGSAADLVLDGDSLLCGGQKLRLYGLANPEVPVLLDSLELAAPVLALGKLPGSSRYCALDAGTLICVDFASDGGPSVIGSLPLDETASCLAVEGNRAWIGMESGGILPVDLSSPDSPVAGERLDTPGNTRALLYHDGLLLVADETSFRILTAPPDGPLEEQGSASPGTGLRVLAAIGDVAACLQYGFGIRLYDISVPNDPRPITLLNQYLAFSYTKQMTFAGNDLLLAGRYLFSIDVSRPEDPHVLGLTPTNNLRGLALETRGEIAWVLASAVNASQSHLEVMSANCDPGADHAFSLEADETERVGLNGETASFTVHLANRGDFPGHYSVATSPSTWPVTLHDAASGEILNEVPELGLLETFLVEVRVHVPESPLIFSDTVSLLAASLDDPEQTEEVQLVTISSCWNQGNLPGTLAHEELAGMSTLGDGEWLGDGNLAWLAPELPAVLLIDDTEGTLSAPPITLAPGDWRGLAWQASGGGHFWTSRGMELVRLDLPDHDAQFFSMPELMPASGARVAGMTVDARSERLWVLMDGPEEDQMLTVDISGNTPEREFQNGIEWNIACPDGVRGLDYSEETSQMLAFGLPGAELECITDIGAGVVSARGDFCPSGLELPFGLALGGDGSVYTPWLDGDAFRIRRYAAPCQTTDVRSVGVQRPSHFGLVASPNPFNPSTNIRFSLDRTGPVRLAVYNLAGQLLETLVEDTLPGGDHRVQWRAGTSASGLYLLRIDGPGPGGRQSEVQRILLVR